MKNLYMFILLFFVAVATETFAQTAPRTEFAIQLSKNALEVKAGTTTELNVNIHRSKTYTKSKAKLGFSSQLPEGVSVTFEPAEGMFETSVATIKVAENAKVGNYQLILNAELNNKVKGSIVKLVITEAKGNAVVSLNE
ncbi:MAG: hypothetical protein KF725_14090 [Cyclobacteriaceae bacterium]|nr:hypothetical protein [Cyclobacteriaceae bacterium]UYN87507.1 MAG: hypothetical protein KIT51_04365 [Cyclobacteriaceae bacterium]